jgi:predicted small lipoprotein YifL
MRHTILISALLGALALVACGKKGNLVLPAPPKAPPVHLPSVP